MIISLRSSYLVGIFNLQESQMEGKHKREFCNNHNLHFMNFNKNESRRFEVLIGSTQMKNSRTTSCATVDLASDREFCTARTNVKTKLFQLTLQTLELNHICYLLALLVHHFLHVSRIMVKSLTLRLLMSYIYIYMEHIFLMFLDHT